jgi:hypothetical protein
MSDVVFALGLAALSWLLPGNSQVQDGDEECSHEWRVREGVERMDYPGLYVCDKCGGWRD